MEPKTPAQRLREKRGLTLKEVADAVGTDTGNLSRIESGRQKSVELAEKLVKFYGPGADNRARDPLPGALSRSGHATDEAAPEAGARISEVRCRTRTRRAGVRAHRESNPFGKLTAVFPKFKGPEETHRILTELAASKDMSLAEFIREMCIVRAHGEEAVRSVHIQSHRRGGRKGSTREQLEKSKA
jgi:transcriptional regulator with XRE-family HTH domain